MMKNEKMSVEETKDKNESLQNEYSHVKGNMVKTPFQKDQSIPPFQGYNYFGTKPKWD